MLIDTYFLFSIWEVGLHFEGCPLGFSCIIMLNNIILGSWYSLVSFHPGPKFNKSLTFLFCHPQKALSRHLWTGVQRIFRIIDYLHFFLQEQYPIASKGSRIPCLKFYQG